MNSEHRRVFYGWRVVAAAALGLFWGVPITVFSFSAFLKPLMQNFHAGRAAVSLAFTLHLVIGALSTPLAGWLIARYGARKVILAGTSMFGAVLLSNRFLSTTLLHFYFFYGVLGLMVHGMGPIPYGHVVSHWFDRRRGLALGLMMIGIGSGAMIMPAFAHGLIARYGWHAAYAILGALVLIIPIPIIVTVLRDKPCELGLLPDGAKTQLGAALPPTNLVGIRRSEALRSQTFWILVGAFSLTSVSVQGCLVHMTAILSDRGVTAETAALGASVMGAAVLIGRVGTGYLLDRFLAPHLAVLLFGGAAAGIGLLLVTSSPTGTFVAAFLVGLGLGAEVDMIAYMVSRYFGLRSFAEIYSLVFGAFALAGAFGPLIMGAGFDRTGSYRAPLVGFLLATLVAAALMKYLGPYRFRVSEKTETIQMLPIQAEDQPHGI